MDDEETMPADEQAKCDIICALQRLRQENKVQGTRERSLVITKLEEALMWLEAGKQEETE